MPYVLEGANQFSVDESRESVYWLLLPLWSAIGFAYSFFPMATECNLFSEVLSIFSPL